MIKKGFTLIELMVVILIIMLLATVITVNVDQARKKARDAKRIADMSTVASALQAYYADNHYYPQPWTGPWTCDFYYPTSKQVFAQLIPALRSGNYLNSCPTDPTNSSNTCNGQSPDMSSSNPYGYRYTCGNPSSDPSSPCTFYILGVHLEQSSGATSIVPSGCHVAGPGCSETLPTGPEYRLKDGEPTPVECF